MAPRRQSRMGASESLLQRRTRAQPAHRRFRERAVRADARLRSQSRHLPGPAEAARERARVDESGRGSARPDVPHPGTGDDAAATVRVALHAFRPGRPRHRASLLPLGLLFGLRALRSAPALGVSRSNACAGVPVLATVPHLPDLARSPVARRMRRRAAGRRHRRSCVIARVRDASAPAWRSCRMNAEATAARSADERHCPNGRSLANARSRPLDRAHARARARWRRTQLERAPPDPSRRRVARNTADAFREIRTRLLALGGGQNFVTLVVPVSSGSRRQLRRAQPRRRVRVRRSQDRAADRLQPAPPGAALGARHRCRPRRPDRLPRPSDHRRRTDPLPHRHRRACA